MTILAHHLSILPTVHKHQRCVRMLRELARVVEELENSEPIWRNFPNAARNRQILKKYKQQVQVWDISWLLQNWFVDLIFDYKSIGYWLKFEWHSSIS